MFESVLIYYFSGTGNTLRVVKAINEEFVRLGIKSAIWNVEKGICPSHNDFSVIGFAYPVHFYGMPYPISDFIETLPYSKDKCAFVVSTMGGWKMRFKLGENFVLYSAKRKLERLGFRFIGGTSVIMPENFSVMYNPPDSAQAQSIVERAVCKAKEFALRLAYGKTKRKYKIGPDFVLWALLRLIFRIWRKYGRLDTFFKVNDNCNSCGLCERACPTQNIKLTNGIPIWNKTCVLCFRCINICPKKAIEYTFLTRHRRQYIEPSTKIDELFHPRE